MPRYPERYDAARRAKRLPGGAAAIEAALLRYTVTPAASSNTAVASALALTTSAQPAVTAGITSPAVPRALRVAGTAVGMTGNVVITGLDIAGNTITETFALNGTTGIDGTRAFAAVTSVALPVRTNPGDTVNIGTLSALGLPVRSAHNTVIRAVYNNTVEGTAPTVTVSATDISLNTATLATTLAGAVVDLYIIG